MKLRDQCLSPWPGMRTWTRAGLGRGQPFLRLAKPWRTGRGAVLLNRPWLSPCRRSRGCWCV